MRRLGSSPLLSRTLAVALLLGVVAGGITLALGPWIDLRADFSEKIDAERRLLGHYAAIAEDVRLQPNARPRDETLAETTRLFLPGETDSARTATLQATLADFARRDGIRFESSRGTAARERNETRVIGVEVRFSGDIAAVQRLMLAVENAEPLLFVDGLQISAAGAGTGRDGTDGRLEVKLDVVGAVAKAAAETQR